MTWDLKNFKSSYQTWSLAVLQSGWPAVQQIKTNFCQFWSFVIKNITRSQKATLRLSYHRPYSEFELSHFCKEKKEPIAQWTIRKNHFPKVRKSCQSVNILALHVLAKALHWFYYLFLVKYRMQNDSMTIGLLHSLQRQDWGLSVMLRANCQAG